MSANETWQVFAEMPVVVHDLFDRDETDDWGEIRGEEYTLSGGTATDYSIATGLGAGILFSATGLKQTRVGPNLLDGTATWRVKPTVAAAGGPFDLGGRLRSTAQTGYEVLVRFAVGGTTQLRVNAVVDGSAAAVSTATLSYTYTAASEFVIVADVTGGVVRARAYDAAEDDPVLWQIAFEDSKVNGPGAVGCVGRVQAGNTNVPFTPRWTSVVWTSPGRRVDITPYVDTIRSPIAASDGISAEASDTGGATLAVNNSRQWFTPGNVRSPFYPNVTAGRRIWIEETLGYERFTTSAGFLEFPEIDAWTESTDDVPRDQTLTLSIVDKVAQLTNAETFQSTLAAHIMSVGERSGALRAYYVLNEASEPFADQLGGKFLAQALTSVAPWRLTPGSEPVAPGDDASGLGFRNDLLDQQNAGGRLRDPSPPSTGTPVADTDVVTVVLWYDADDVTNLPAMAWLLGSSIEVQLDVIGTTRGTVNVDSMTATVNGNTSSTGKAVMMAVRVRKSPALVELWVDGDLFTGTLSGAAGGGAMQATYFDYVGEWYTGRLAHLQLWIGPDEDFGLADLEEQWQVGLHGLEAQLTGERVRTILRYAGVGDGELSGIDDGTVVMQRANLAGSTPGDALRAAEETEQGRLGTDGANHVTFADRRRLYNI